MLDLNTFAQYGAVGLTAALFIWLFLSSRKESREDRNQMRADLLKSREECQAENDKIAARLQEVENRQHKEMASALVISSSTNEKCATALIRLGEAVERIADHTATGRHQARES